MQADPKALDGLWHEILREAGLALDGGTVGLWESDEQGHLRPLATSGKRPPPATTGELESAVSRWHMHPSAGSRIVAGRLKNGRWYVAPVRRDPPVPPPSGVERRGRERLMLELTAAYIGSMSDQRSWPPPGEVGRDEMVEMMLRGLRELEDFFENAAIGIHWAAPDGTILRANKAELEMLGYPVDEYVGRNIAEFHVDPGIPAQVLQRLRSGETVTNLEAEMRRRDGTTCHVLINTNALIENGRFIHTRAVTRDISHRVRDRRSLAQFKAIVESADDAIIAKTLDGIVTGWNPAAERLYGYAAEEMIGTSIAVILPPERVPEFATILERLARGERLEHHETTCLRKDGMRLEVSVTFSPILDEGGRPIGASAIARDITDRKRADELLLHGALHDSLTDLPNRAFFIERVGMALERSRRDASYRFAVLFLDFDNFKLVNDSLGHVVGDQLLMRIAARLQTCVRPGDIVARLGGDEFTLLLEDVASPADIERATTRIQQRLATPFVLEGKEIIATASIGVALNTAGYEQPEELLRDADLAMYRAKEQGRARIQLFNVAMRERVHTRFGLEADLRNAIERGELRLVFQPIVELKTRRLHAFEALLRWHHSVRGVIQPMEFIPIAEDSGLIVPIGKWVLREACWHARRWQQAFPEIGPVRVSVNISARQLRHPNIVDDVREAIREEGIDPRRLRLEITETVLMENVELSTSILGWLRALGVELHVDDFGTGYSSLSYLPRFPVQAIKIDRLFTHRMGLRRNDQELVRSIVDLAKNLGIGVIAEGVETAMQRDRLISFGCELGQGFHFAKPLDPVAARALLEASAYRARD